MHTVDKPEFLQACPLSISGLKDSNASPCPFGGFGMLGRIIKRLGQTLDAKSLDQNQPDFPPAQLEIFRARPSLEFRRGGLVALQANVAW
jgi:hypothetical protein